MRDHDDLPYVVIERRSAGAGPFLWGVAIGAVAGVLLAPKAGSETQDELRERVRRVRSATGNKVDAARDTVTRTRDRIEGGVDTVRNRFDTVRDQIDTRAEQGRQAAREARHELERRINEARGSSSADAPAAPVARPMDPRPMDSRPTGPQADPAYTDLSGERAEGRIDLG